MIRSTSAVLLLSLAACNTTGKPTSAAKSVDVVQTPMGWPTPPTCEGGESLQFQPVDVDGVVRSDVSLTGEFEFIGQLAENDHRGYRLDLCIDAQTDAITLIQMVRRVPSTSPFAHKYIEMKPDSVASSETWGAALASGGAADLEVVFVNQNDAAKSVLLKGWKNASGVQFVTISDYNSAIGDKYAVTSPAVFYGKLLEGDPWLTTYNPHNRLVEVPGLRIELRYKVKEGQNNYKSYIVESAKVIDTNPGLATPFEGFVTDVEDPSKFEVVYTHHSLMDQFRIKFPHAVYEVGGGLKAIYDRSTGLPAKTFDFECGEISTCGVPL